MKNVLATYSDSEDLINIGAYKSGSSAAIDYAIAKIDAVNEFLMQEVEEKFEYQQTVDMLKKLFESNNSE